MEVRSRRCCYMYRHILYSTTCSLYILCRIMAVWWASIVIITSHEIAQLKIHEPTWRGVSQACSKGIARNIRHRFCPITVWSYRKGIYLCYPSSRVSSSQLKWLHGMLYNKTKFLLYEELGVLCFVEKEFCSSSANLFLSSPVQNSNQACNILYSFVKWLYIIWWMNSRVLIV